MVQVLLPTSSTCWKSFKGKERKAVTSSSSKSFSFVSTTYCAITFMVFFFFLFFLKCRKTYFYRSRLIYRELLFKSLLVASTSHGSVSLK